MKKYILDNLDCADCALKLEREIEKLEYVKDVSISFPTKTMLIDTDRIEDVKIKIKEIEGEVLIKESTRDKEKIDSNNEIKGLDKEKNLIIYSFSIFIITFILEKLGFINLYIYTFLYILSYIIIAIPILIGAYKSIKNKDYFDEKVLMSISTIAAFFIGAYEEACGVMIFYSIGEYFQNLAVIKSKRDIKSLLELKENIVHIVIDTEKNTKDVNIEDVHKNSYLLVKAGEVVPLDGIIIKGSGDFNMSMLTGESIPVFLKTNDTVLAGSLNLSNTILIKTINEYENSSMFKLIEMIEDSMHKKSKVDKFITSFSKWYTPSIITLAILIGIIPPIITDITYSKSIYSAIVLLVISCPCALVLSIPLTYFIALGKLAKNGVLIKAINVFDKINKAKILFLDKTGTITEGKFHIIEINEYFDRVKEISEKEILEHVYLAEKNSNHPVAKSIVEFIKQKYGLTNIIDYNEHYKEFISYCLHCGCCHKPVEHNNNKITFVEEYRHSIGHFDEDLCNTHNYTFSNEEIDKDFAKDINIISVEEIMGQGIKMITYKYEVLIGNDIFMKNNKVLIPDSAFNIRQVDGTNINVAIDKEYIMNIYLEDKIKKDSKFAIGKLKELGIKKVIMLTGDSKKVAKELASKIKLDEYFCGLLPKDKLEKLEEYEKNENTIFVGDGMNDAPVISRASIGIAMGKAGSDITVNSADVVINNDSLTKIIDLKNTSKKIKYIIYENISLILLVKFSIIILGLFSKVSMWGAVFGDVGIAIIAILNSMRLRK